MKEKMTGSKRVTVEEAAEQLNVSAQSVREHIKRGLWDIGLYEKKPGSKRGTYHIYRAKLEKHLGERE